MPAKSKAQQKFMGLVKSYQDGDVPASKVSKAVKDAAKNMGEKEVDKYASTKHKGLPNKKERVESILKENPVAIAATQGALRAMKKAKVQGKSGRPIAMTTALNDKSQPAHRKAKGVFAKLVDKFKKKKKPKSEPKKQPKKQSQSDVDHYKKQFGVGRTGKELKKEVTRMKPQVKKLLKQKGYGPIFGAIDNSKRQLKQMRYSRGEIQDTLISMFGDEDPKILQKIKESKEDMLKRIIKEEVKKVITEGTRWLVGIEDGRGKIISTYGHYDGYPQWAGKHLKKYYNNPQKAKELLKLGKSGISTIGPKIKGNKDHSFKTPNKGVTVFYGRDRGEKDRMTQNWKDRDAVDFDMGEEYAYIYSLNDKKWYYKSRYSNPKDWTEL